MGIVVRSPSRRHARISLIVDNSGRGTCSGQGVSSGQRSENQRITSSYLRAVNVLPSSSSLSKKRQSPAASRPTVATLTERASANAEAQAMRFERSSASIMASEDSRKIPTFQARNVGKFLLAQVSEKSDKSAMADVDEIRRTLKRVMKERGTGAVALANRLGLGRTYISDFLSGKKRSLGITEATAIAELLEIPLKELTPELERPQAIRKGVRPHLYITEHMEHRGLDDEAVSRRTEGIPPAAIAAWRAKPATMENWQVAAVLHALDMEDISELARLPTPAPKPAATTRKRFRRTA